MVVYILEYSCVPSTCMVSNLRFKCLVYFQKHILTNLKINYLIFFVNFEKSYMSISFGIL